MCKRQVTLGSCTGGEEGLRLQTDMSTVALTQANAEMSRRHSHVNKTRRLVRLRHGGSRTRKNARPAELPPHLELPSALRTSLASKRLNSRTPPEETLRTLLPPSIAVKHNFIASETVFWPLSCLHTFRGS
jgi:hypothetical protein